MSVNKDIADLIPLLVSGRLSEVEEKIVREQISQSAELQREYELWLGIYAVRGDLPRYDASAHPLPEAMDRLAQGKINQLSAEYTELSAHLQRCQACGQDVELLRQAVKLIPEDHHLAAGETRRSWLESVFGLRAPSLRALAPVLSFVVIMLGLFLVFQKANQGGDTATIVLKPQFEKRSLTDPTKIAEMQVFLKQSTNKVIFSFSTDRIDIPQYDYVIDLTPAAGTPVKLNESNIKCTETQLKNQCELTVTDSAILNRLKQGGSFALSIKEQFPASVQLEPAEYEYYFKVTVR
jgi:hypothetical protein